MYVFYKQSFCRAVIHVQTRFNYPSYILLQGQILQNEA